MAGSTLAKPTNLDEYLNILISPISLEIDIPVIEAIPGIDVMGESVSWASSSVFYPHFLDKI